jgi:nicotinamide mononucleotide transporter
VLESLYTAHLTISGHQITWREIVGNAFGLASAAGGLRRRVWSWPVGVVGNAMLLTVFLGTALQSGQGAPLYGQAARQVFFIVLSIYGWVRWRSHQANGEGRAAVVPRWASRRERTLLISAALPAVAVCFAVFRSVGAGFPVPWWYFLADSWIFVGSMAATYAMARGWVEFWLCWIAVDMVGIPELLHFNYYPSATLYGVYGTFVIYGLIAWRKLVRAQYVRRSARPQRKSVEAHPGWVVGQE